VSLEFIHKGVAEAITYRISEVESY